MITKQQRSQRRKYTVRARIRPYVSSERPRLSVFRSGKHIYAQVIDDTKGCTLVAGSTVDKELRPQLAAGYNKKAAERVGQLVAKRALAKGVTKVVFDRSGYLYHGRVASLAEAARAEGLEF